MKTKIKTAHDRAATVVSRFIRNGDTFDLNELAKAFDNHARRAHERHARKNRCFVGFELLASGRNVMGLKWATVIERKRK